MLRISVPETELYDDQRREFVTIASTELVLEHSLVSISKWEARWGVPFLDTKNKTSEQTLDYIRSMTVGDEPDPIVYSLLKARDLEAVTEYIASPMTATTVRELKQSANNGVVVTSELIYYWMIAMSIPFECQHWHLNRLITLIRVCQAKSGDQKKMSSKEIAEQNRKLNAQRRAKLNSRG